MPYIENTKRKEQTLIIIVWRMKRCICPSDDRHVSLSRTSRKYNITYEWYDVRRTPHTQHLIRILCLSAHNSRNSISAWNFPSNNAGLRKLEKRIFGGLSILTDVTDSQKIKVVFRQKTAAFYPELNTASKYVIFLQKSCG